MAFPKTGCWSDAKWKAERGELQGGSSKSKGPQAGMNMAELRDREEAHAFRSIMSSGPRGRQGPDHLGLWVFGVTFYDPAAFGETPR